MASVELSEREQRDVIAVGFLPLARRAVWSRFRDDPYTLRHIEDLVSVAYERVVRIARDKPLSDLARPDFKSFVYKSVINACYSWIRDQGRCFRDRDSQGLYQLKILTDMSSCDNAEEQTERECNRAIALELIERGRLSARQHQAMLLWLNGFDNAEVEQQLSLKGTKAGIKLKHKCVARIKGLAMNEKLKEKVAL